MQRLLALSASAGSGKTFALVARYLSLLFKGANPSEILAITFTNKAAGEMRERLVASLDEMKPEMAQEIARMSGIGVDEIEAKRANLLRRFLSADLKVMTIDRFIHQVLRKFCWYVGLQSDFQISPLPKEEFFERYLESLGDREYRTLVDFARFEERKSRSFIDFFELLYEKDKELPKQILDVQMCSEDEVMERANRIAAFFLESSVSERAKNSMRFESLAEVVSKKWFEKESLDYWDYKRVYEPVVDIWLAELKEAVKRYYLCKERYFLANIFTLYRRYKNVKMEHMKRAGDLYFKDIENLVFELLREKDFTRFLYFRLDAKISHILFDEFQDTSVTQYRIFEPIIEEIASGESDRTFFYVGDTKQSIYRFRGGQKALFGYVAERFGVKIGHLQTNYRSKSAIVEFVNETFDYVKPPQTANEKGGYVKVSEGDPMDELERALRRFFDMGVKDEDIAVLVHDNKEILKVEELVQEKFGKKISTHKRAKVTEQPSAKAIIELMRLAYSLHRGEEGALHRLNFLSLVNRPYDPNFKPVIKRGRAAVMVKDIMDSYGFFDEAAMKLLEFSIPLNDLTEFIHEIERYEDELPAGELKGINVLTIHKSKGLEFEHVIVLDRLGRSRSDTSPLIFDYSGIELNDIRVKFKNREIVDEEYAAAIKRERRLEAEDGMNRSYVAFTRAKTSLVVLKKERSSVFTSLNFREVEIGSIERSAGKEIEKKGSPSLTYSPKNYGRQEVSHELKRYEANDFDAIYTGLGVHYLFENEDIDALMNRYGSYCDVERVEKLVEISKANIEYNILTEGEIYHELPFVYENRVGVVDLFVDKGERGVIIDYKTATPHDISGYIEQVRWYKDALFTLMPGKMIEGYIYFLDTQKLLKIE